MKLRVSFCFSPDEKIPVGTLMDSGRDVAFEYDRGFAATGLQPAPFRLPVREGASVFDHSGGMEVFGVFEDSLPDGWGRRLVDRSFRRKFGRAPSVLERLACVGLNGMGALVYEPDMEIDSPQDEFDLPAVADSAMDFDAGKVEDVLPSVRRAGGSSGGARPKALVGFNPKTGEACPESVVLPEGFEHWIVKFNTRTEGDRAGEAEFRYWQAARRAGVAMSEARLVETSAGKFFATRRFDRAEGGRRLHLASAAGLLHADFRVPGDEYSILFRLADALTRDASVRLELFRRVVLNVVAHNRDDHLKNFSFLMDVRGRWSLAPFYDFTFAAGPNGWHTLSVAGEGANPKEDDLRRLAESVGIADEVAREEYVRIVDVCGDLPRLI